MISPGRALRIAGGLVLVVAVVGAGVGVTGILMSRSLAATWALGSQVHGTPVDEAAWRTQWLVVSALAALGGAGGIVAGVALLRGRRAGLAILAITLAVVAGLRQALLGPGAARYAFGVAGRVELVVLLLAAAAAGTGWMLAGRRRG